MKTKTIEKVLSSLTENWIESIEDSSVRDKVRDNIVITGGCIASMLLKEKVNDYDIYFTNLETTKAVAEYYVSKSGIQDIAVNEEGGRVKITTPSGHRGETVGIGEIEDLNEAVEEEVQEQEVDTKFTPVFFSTNAITLSDKVQIILRFYGSPEEIHDNYDFIHCTNYWTSKDKRLELKKVALESIITRELRYVGSLYPVCSIIRLRKFIKRNWTVNAGQILKMTLQASELDLADPEVLEDQLTGVDAAYFHQVIKAVKDKDPSKLNVAYLVEIIDRIF